MKFACSNCGAILAVGEELAGQPVACSECAQASMAPENRFSPGAVIGDFVVEEALKGGTYAADCLCRQATGTHQFHLKVFADNLCQDPDFQAHFAQRSQLLINLDHAVACKTFAAREDEGIYYLAREAIPFDSLVPRLQLNTRIDPLITAELCAQVSDALAHAWKTAGLYHGNLKPDMIFLSNSVEVKIADIGILQLIEVPSNADAIKGTPQYMAPDMIHGAQLDTRTDVYSLGAVMFHMITGEFPFGGNTPHEILENHLEAPVPSAHERFAGCPEELDMIIRWMMAKNPEERYPDFVQVAAALRAVISGSPIIGPAAVAATNVNAKMAAPVENKISGKIPAVRMPPGVGSNAPKPAPGSPANPPPPGSSKRPRAAGSKTSGGGGGGGGGKRKFSKKGGSTTIAMPGVGSKTTIPRQTSTSMSAVPPKKKSKAIPVLLTMMFIGFVVVVGGGLVAYSMIMPDSPSDVQSRYFGLVTISKNEEQAYQQIERYVKEDATYFKNSIADLENASELMHNFVELYPKSMFCMPNDQIDYLVLFGAPTFAEQKYRTFGAKIAGRVPGKQKEYEELLVQQRREERHKKAMKELAELQKEIKRKKREEELARKEEEAAQRALERKAERLNTLMDKRDELRVTVRETAGKHNFDKATGMLRALASETDETYQEPAQWARDMRQAIEKARVAYESILDCGPVLAGERLQIILPNTKRKKRVEIRSWRGGTLSVKYKDLVKDKDTGRIENKTINEEVPLASIPYSEFEIIARLALEKASVKDDFYLLMGCYYYFIGESDKAKVMLNKATDAIVDLLLQEIENAK
jgi:serine/threonine protein kinase